MFSIDIDPISKFFKTYYTGLQYLPGLAFSKVFKMMELQDSVFPKLMYSKITQEFFLTYLE